MSIFKDLFTQKRVLITGAGKGLGNALTKEMYKLGAKIWAVSRTQEDLDLLQKECPGIRTICLDISDWEKTREILEENLMEPIDILVNNAAILGPTTVMSITSENFDEIVNTNLKSIVNASQICVSKMISSGKGGCIINVSSMFAIRPAPQAALYSALKAALDSLTKTMSIEFGPHQVRVLSMNFGFMWTTMVTKRFPTEEERLDFLESQIPNFPSGNPCVPLDEAVNSILFVASGKVDSMTGCGFVMDCGYCARP